MKVSIYIPTKNRLDLLKIAVDSVLRQTYESIELIVVNDGSTDETQKYLEQLTASDNRVKYINNAQSKGACAARNAAIESASGYFLTGLDDDDLFEPCHIAALVSYWQLLEAASQKFSAIYVQDQLRNYSVINVLRKPSSVKAEDMLLSNCVGNQIFSTKEKFLSAGLFDQNMPAWQDLEFYYRFLKIHGPARLLDIPSYIFDVSPRGDRISVGSKLKIVNACESFIRKHNISDQKIQQQLLMQVYARYYGFNVTLKDVITVLKLGWNVKVLYRIVLRWANR